MSTKENPIVFCSYQKKLENLDFLKKILKEEKKKNENFQKIKKNQKIQKIEKIENFEFSEKKIFLIPKNFFFKILNLNNKIKIDIEEDFCEHKKLKPLYEDLYLNIKKKFIKENKFEIDFSKKKKFNKNFLKNFSKIENNFTVIKYFSECDSVSKKIYEFFQKNYFLTKKKKIQIFPKIEKIENFENFENFQKCKICEKTLKKLITKKIFEKALIINLLGRKKKEKKFLIDKIWFSNYTSHILSDLKNSKKSRFNFSKNFIKKKKINSGILKIYSILQEKYSNEKNLVKNEFIFVNKSLYQFLSQIYGVCENLALNEKNQIIFFEEKEMEIFFDGFFLNFEEKFVFNIFKKKIKNFENYEKILILNEKMNSYIDFKIESDFEIFNKKKKNEKNFDLKNYDKKFKKKFFRLKKNFDIKNLENFNPCKIIFGIFSENDKILQKKKKNIF